MSLHTTGSQTVGPYLHIGLTWLVTDNLVGPGVTGDKVSVEGRITDGDGKPVNDAMVEIWQADSRGRYGTKSFRGFGRSATDANGVFRFRTIKPGRVPGPGGKLQAPHIEVQLREFALGLQASDPLICGGKRNRLEVELSFGVSH